MKNNVIPESDIPLLPPEDSETESDDRSLEAIQNVVLSLLKQLESSETTPCSLEDDPDSDCGSDTGSQSVDSEVEDDVPGSQRRANLVLTLVNRHKEGHCGSTYKRIKYPKRCASGSLKHFARLLRVLDLVNEAIVDGIPATKRDIYYRDVPLFRSQRIVDTLVDDLAATFDLQRSDLNIRATSKGLVCGSGLLIHLHTGETIALNDTEGTLIPAGEDVESFSLVSDISWVLVVEKEAIFQTLCRLRVTDHSLFPGRGLMITGKGYPDIATRHLTKTLADALPRLIPIMALVDGDPHGLGILSVYKYGSRSLRHENEILATSRIQWMGIRYADFESMQIDRDKLLPITDHDVKKCLSMLHNPSCELPPSWRRVSNTNLVILNAHGNIRKELMRILHNRRKAEIEILMASDTLRLARCDPMDSSDGHDSSLLLEAGVPSLLLESELDPGSKLSSRTAICHASLEIPLIRYLARKITDFVKAAKAPPTNSGNMEPCL